MVESDHLDLERTVSCEHKIIFFELFAFDFQKSGGGSRAVDSQLGFYRSGSSCFFNADPDPALQNCGVTFTLF